jgi:hemoglobin
MTSGTRDIATRADIVRLVDAFYSAVRGDEILGPIFDGVAHVDWDRHLPRMYDFWEGVLFGATAFRGNPLAVHLSLAGRVALGSREFDRWIALFHEQVDALFSGAVADEAKARALRIAAVMQYHIGMHAGAGVAPGTTRVT